MRGRYVIVSGIPGCGKSTIGRTLAERLALPFIDKDDILEAMFDALGCPDVAARQRLSRASDGVLEAVAQRCPEAVLCSFWRPPTSASDSGTPVGWLTDPEIRIIELFCHCSPELAASRFIDRVRHPGHHDEARNRAALSAQSLDVVQSFPLGIGHTIEVDTTDPVDVGKLADEVRQALGP